MSGQAFQKDLGKRTSGVQALKRSARDLMDTGRDDTAWVKVQVHELSNRWDTVCALSVSKQTRLQQALKQVSSSESHDPGKSNQWLQLVRSSNINQ